MGQGILGRKKGQKNGFKVCLGCWKNINKAIEDETEQEKGNNSSGQIERATSVSHCKDSVIISVKQGITTIPELNCKRERIEAARLLQCSVRSGSEKGGSRHYGGEIGTAMYFEGNSNRQIGYRGLGREKKNETGSFRSHLKSLYYERLCML